MARRTFWVQPIILTNTRSDMAFLNEEIFGPVAVIIKFRDEDDVEIGERI